MRSPHPDQLQRRDTVALVPKGLQNPDRAADHTRRGFDTLSLRQTFQRLRFRLRDESGRFLWPEAMKESTDKTGMLTSPLLKV
jgi:hypothetical protein